MKLTLKRETLASLDADSLRAVAGADGSGVACLTENLATCRISDVVISLCGCLTSYCSIDVC